LPERRKAEGGRRKAEGGGRNETLGFPAGRAAVPDEGDRGLGARLFSLRAPGAAPTVGGGARTGERGLRAVPAAAGVGVRYAATGRGTW
jgi:hypothetical protein